MHASKPTLKRLWASLVSAKVMAQAAALPPGEAAEPVRTSLRAMAQRVRSGDPDNIEAQAAALYWPHVFSLAASMAQPFRRRSGDRTAPPPNNLLDYGYAVLRASLARSLVSAGLLPAIGIKHQGRSNPFCLADDLIEPLRPLVDQRVRWLAERGELELDQPTKAELLNLLTDEVTCGQRGADRGPLMVAMTRYVASVVRVLTGEQATADIPTWSSRGRAVTRNNDGGSAGSEDE